MGEAPVELTSMQWLILRWKLALAVVWMASLAGVASGRTTMDVEIGFGESIRNARWTPVFVTAYDPALATARNVILELSVPLNGIEAPIIRQGFTIGPTPRTFVLYAPVSQGTAQDLTAVLRDAASDRKLADYLAREDINSRFGSIYGRFFDREVYVGISGHSPYQRLLAGQFSRPEWGAGVLEPARLPSVPVGYDSLDALILTAPDFDAIDVEQQRAILDWVRNGGNLIVIPGADPIPPSGPIVDALPARIGAVTSYGLDRATRSRLKLPERFDRLGGRELTPVPGAQTGSLFDLTGALTAQRRLGLGQVLVIGPDVSQLRMSGPAAMDFWRPLLVEMVVQRPAGTPYYAWNANPRSQEATNFAMDLLGEIPGVGTFGFSYIAIVMIGMALVVGPVDWLVLKLLHRQPWTWITTSGWIVLVTAGAVFIGYIFRSGDLHIRTLSVIDQVDEQLIGAMDVACIYAPRTGYYPLEVATKEWWSPPLLWMGDSGMKSPLEMVQDQRGNRPPSSPGMFMNVWNLRFLRGESFEPAPRLIEIKLSRTAKGLGGTLKNLGPEPLTDLAIRAGAGWVELPGTIAPGETYAVDAKIQPGDPITDSQAWIENDRWRRVAESKSVIAPTRAMRIAEMSQRRSAAIDRLLKSTPQVACVYAMSQPPAGPASLPAPDAIGKHWRVIRAVSPLEVKP